MNTNKATGSIKDQQLSSVRVLRVIVSKPLYYHSVRIDQRQHRAIHVLPEKYQFCSLGSARTGSNSSSDTSPFGSCRAKVHYGLCTDFDVFVVNENNTGTKEPSTTANPTSADSNARFVYSVKPPSIQSPNPNEMTRSATSNVEQPMSPTTNQSIAARIESYRENIGAALELLNDYDEPSQLQNLIRNFVREDRRRQGSQQQQSSRDDDLEQKLLEAVQSLDSKGHKITLKKSQADLLQRLQHQKGIKSTNAVSLDQSNQPTTGDPPFLSSNREGVVQSRLIRFAARPSSPNSFATLLDGSPESPLLSSQNGTNESDFTHKIHNDDNSKSIVNSEKTVFGISPKSSSLSRYKSLIESRSGSSSPVNFSIGFELDKLTEQQAPSSSTSSSSLSSGSKYFGQNSSNSHIVPNSNLQNDVGSQGKSRESFLEITGANLDSSHLSNHSSASPWKQHSSSLGSVSSSGSVNDTAKCIAVVSCTASPPNCTSAPSSSASPQSQPYLSARTSSTSPVSTSVTIRQQLSNKSSESSSSHQLGTVRNDTRPNDQHHSQSSTSYHRSTPNATLANSTSNSIDTFIQENEQFFKSGNKLSRSVGLIEDHSDFLDCDFEDSDENMKIPQNKLSSLTDDEKALLHETLKVGLYGVISDPKKRQMLNSQNGLSDSGDENCDPNQAHLKPNRRIILVSKPVPKPEPKPEPKYVNGKVVFGQLPVKPVLQKGSVAERVMLFEKCPEKTSVTKGKLHELQKNRITNPNKIGSWVRSGEKDVKIPKIANNSVSSSPSRKAVTEEPKSPTIATVPTFRRFSRSNSLTGTLPGQLPRFYFPNGRPYSSHEVESQIKRIIAVFERFPSRTVTRKELGGVLKLVGIPVYWKEPLFCAVLANTKCNGINGACNGTINGRRSASRSNSIDLSNGKGSVTNGKKEYITCEQFTDYWKKVISTCFDDAARFIHIVSQGRRSYILHEDLESMIQDVIDTHPGLLFLKEAEEFHSRYVHTVIARVFYCLDKTWSGTITLPELRKSNFLKVLQLLEEEEDINQITEYFSYEHFYVIYCKFWELDQDHDLFISKFDLSRHNDSAISSRMIDRIFSGAVTRGPRSNENQMSYAEFVWFILSEEDKRHPRAIEYWFRCMDLDGDGALSMYELEYFYSEQVKRMEAAGIEALPFTDCLCQMIDLASPQDPVRITLNDLKRCRLTPVFFDTFFNLEKYLDHEQRDPFASQRDEDGLSMSDWDRYAAEEYEMLVAEENAQNGPNRIYSYSQSHQRYPTEEVIDVDDYDEEDDEDDQDAQDQDSEEELQNEYSLEEVDEHFAHQNDNFDDSDDSFSDNSSEQFDQSESQFDSVTRSEVAQKNRTPEQLELDQNEGDLKLVNSKVNQESTASEPSKSHSAVIPYDIDEIGKEFYEYINAEFGPHLPISSNKVTTVQRRPYHQNDYNNNPTNFTLDDDDFW